MLLSSIGDPSAPLFILKRDGDDKTLVMTGKVVELDLLDQIPRRRGVPGNSRRAFDSVFVMPFRQIRERGYEVRDGGEPIFCLEVERCEELDHDVLLGALPDETVSSSGGAFDIPEDEYARTVQSIILNEIGRGEGANFVIRRTFRTRIDDFDHAKALSFLKNLLTQEHGAYWTYLFFTGDRYFVGATPERHISSTGGRVKMNPISGTFRKDEWQPAELKGALFEFLQDRKEIFELFMVVDEELKVMCELCSHGGQIVGPLLKEMSHLVHTEYLLTGSSDVDPIALLRNSMFAATVTGSPVENACRVIARNEPDSRRYYGSIVATLGRDAEGVDMMDSSILIRTAEIDASGDLILPVGATLVRDSDPAAEARETNAKVAGLMAALGIEGKTGNGEHPMLGSAIHDEDLVVELNRRNGHLSRFWIEEQDRSELVAAELQGRRITIIDNEDAFTTMLAYMMSSMGIVPTIARIADFSLDAPADLIIMGPGPGDPADLSDPRIASVTDATRALLESERNFMAVCLGHQILCGLLGFSLEKKAVTFQGTQQTVDLFGSPERVGFYNTFVARGSPARADVEVAADPDTGDVHALRSERFQSYQFHAESILTTNGYDILRNTLKALMPG